MTTEKVFDLEKRSLIFAKRVRDFVNKVPKSLANIEYCRQLIRSSGSIAANYIEANESLSKKDYYMRVKICRKESKETILWLNLIENKSDQQVLVNYLIKESQELMRIFGAIITKASSQ